MSWARLVAVIFPQASGFLGRFAPVVLLPVLVPLGYAGYKLEKWLSVPKDESGLPSIADVREQRLKDEVAKEHFGERHFKKTIFEKNASKTEKGVFNRRETMRDS